MRLGIIGYGVIAETLLSVLAGELLEPIERLICLAKPAGAARAASLLEKHRLVALQSETVVDLCSLMRADVDIVVECAGQSALRMYGAPILRSGSDLIISSVGALADETLHATLKDAARSAGTRLYLPAGAVGGIDLLSAARLAGLHEVTYVGRKPPSAWKGTQAESVVDLDNVHGERILYRGNARGAATDYPKNANVAAIIALAGIGFERTRVELIADPASGFNVHELRFRSRAGAATLRIENKPSPLNPKTSLGTAYSVADVVLNMLRTEII